MNSESFRFLIRAFLESKSEINLYFTNQGNYINYTIFNRTIEATVATVDGNEWKTTVNVDTINYNGKIIIKKFHETVYASDGGALEENIIHCKNILQIYLKAFRILGESVSFSISSGDEEYECFFVFGKVIYFMVEEGTLTLYEDNLYNLRKVFKNFEITRLTRRREKENLSMLRNRIFKMASDNNLIYNSEKRGVRVS